MPSPYSVWSIWPELPMFLKFFFLILSLVTVYTLISASAIMMRLRSLRNQRNPEGSSSLQRSLAVLRIRSANMRQIVGATFYLFGFIFFLTLPWVTRDQGDSRTPGIIIIYRNISLYCAFAANVFSVFLVLHSVQWLASSRVSAYSLHLNTRNID